MSFATHALSRLPSPTCTAITSLASYDTRHPTSTNAADCSMYITGTGGSTESGLEQGFERESYDSDQELEAIRGSVRSLRAQRAAVEKLKEKARLQEGTAEELRRKLREAEGKVRELRAQGGRDVVRRLMDEVTNSCHFCFFFRKNKKIYYL